MATEQSTTESEIRFLAKLAHSGVAETLTPKQRRKIHIKTELGDFLSEALDDGKQVVLTGNPGDGKTQQILREQERHPEDEYYYLLDASTYDYKELLEEWQDALNRGLGGILAINDGPLYDIVTRFRSEYPFLQTVQKQLENQLVYTNEETSLDTEEIVVIDLNNRNVLVPDIVDKTIATFAGNIARSGHDHPGTCHVQYNARKLSEHSEVRENLKDLLTEAGQLSDHVTVRDLINFLCYCLTGGRRECITDFSEPLKYYNLAFSGEGKLFDLFRTHFHPRILTHPFVDNQLWTKAEEEVNPRDVEDAREEIEEIFLRKKRRFLFEDEMMDLGFESRTIYQNIDYKFLSKQNSATESSKEDLLERINSYFLPTETKRRELRLWLSHRYRSKSSLALVSRSTVGKEKFSLQKPRLNSYISPAIEYGPTHIVLEYTDSDGPGAVRLRFDRELFSALSALDANIPYTLRDRSEEQQLLEFMEEVEYHEPHSKKRGQITVKDTESGRVVSLEVENIAYRI